MWTFLKPCNKDGEVIQIGLPTSAAKPNLEHKKTKQSIASNHWWGLQITYLLCSILGLFCPTIITLFKDGNYFREHKKPLFSKVFFTNPLKGQPPNFQQSIAFNPVRADRSHSFSAKYFLRTH